MARVPAVLDTMVPMVVDVYEMLLERVKDRLTWHEGNNIARAARLAPNVVFFELGGTVGSEAAKIVDDAMRGFLTRERTLLFWDLAALQEYSVDVRDVALGGVRKHLSLIHGIHTYYVGAPWAVRMGVDLAKLIAMSRVESYDRRTSFVAALTKAVVSA